MSTSGPALLGLAAGHLAANAAVGAAAGKRSRGAWRAEADHTHGDELTVGELVARGALQRRGDDARGGADVHAVREQCADRLVGLVEQPLAGEDAVAGREPVVRLCARLVDEVDRPHLLVHGDVTSAARLCGGEGREDDGANRGSDDRQRGKALRDMLVIPSVVSADGEDAAVAQTVDDRLRRPRGSPTAVPGWRSRRDAGASARARRWRRQRGTRCRRSQRRRHRSACARTPRSSGGKVAELFVGGSESEGEDEEVARL
jgi:hypothetical protein